MSKRMGLAVAVLGILILLGTVYYQAKTEQQALYMVPIGLGVTFLGVFTVLKKSGDK